MQSYKQIIKMSKATFWICNRNRVKVDRANEGSRAGLKMERQKEEEEETEGEKSWKAGHGVCAKDTRGADKEVVETREQIRREEEQKGTRMSPTFDTSSSEHTTTHQGQKVSVSVGTSSCSMTPYISEEEGLRRSP